MFQANQDINGQVHLILFSELDSRSVIGYCLMKTAFVGTYFNLLLTLKALGFFLPVQHWGGGSTPTVKLDADILES